ncbi:MAG: hypothetical protein K2X47_17945, partial [Bdellovibrionales bacterium]|nr:hypothetical protein [Bdellovibrionales bacterium]
PPVTDNNLPLSYHGGAVSKIRFKKAGDPYGVTIYPTMLLNQLMQEDILFLQALGMWKDFCHLQLKKAESVSMSSGVSWATKNAWAFARYWTGFEKQSPGELKANYELYKQAYDQAVESLEQAKWVHEKMSGIEEREIYVLLDLMRAFRGTDLPLCHRQIKDLNEKVASLLGGHDKSSANIKDKSKKQEIDRLAKDVVFYVDQYRVFSTAGARKALELRKAR